jgi:hypothetical protein
LFGTELPADPPWDPVPSASIAQNPRLVSRLGGAIEDASPATIQARTLQVSATRKIWSSLLRLRDWTSYIYVPLLLLLLVVLPYFMVQSYRTSNRVNRLVESMARGRPDVDILRQLMAGPIKSFEGEAFEEAQSIEPPNYKGFTILKDSCVLDLRPWNPSDSTSLVYGARYLRVLKNSDNAGNDIFRIIPHTTHPEAQFRFPPAQYQPRLRRTSVEKSSTQEASSNFEVSVDLSKLPKGQVVDVIYEHYSRDVVLKRGTNFTTVAFPSAVDSLEFTRWLLLPSGEKYRSYQILRYETGKPETAEVVKGLTDYMVDDPGIIAFNMALVKAGYTFEVTWFHD